MPLLRYYTAAALLLLCGTFASADTISWQTNFDEARRDAVLSGKPLLVYVLDSR